MARFPNPQMNLNNRDGNRSKG
uniref:Uncharacterized protein n=1 Tax=Rhizophora mucronata TaxID=61149 RepID=A0A2P2QI11_RHIMU